MRRPQRKLSRTSGDNLSEIVVTGVRMSLKDSIATKKKFRSHR